MLLEPKKNCSQGEFSRQECADVESAHPITNDPDGQVYGKKAQSYRVGIIPGRRYLEGSDQQSEIPNNKKDRSHNSETIEGGEEPVMNIASLDRLATPLRIVFVNRLLAPLTIK